MSEVPMTDTKQAALEVDCPQCGVRGKILSHCKHCDTFIEATLELTKQAEHTPETDAAEVIAYTMWRMNENWNSAGHWVPVEFARQLEVQRDRLRADRDALVEKLDNLQACSASVLQSTMSIKNSLAIDLKSAIEQARALLSRLERP